MLIRIQCEDGQDFLVGFGEGSVSVAIAITNLTRSQPNFEDFTIKEVEAIIKAI